MCITCTVCKCDGHIVNSFISAINMDIGLAIKILNAVIVWDKGMCVYNHTYDPSTPDD